MKARLVFHEKRLLLSEAGAVGIAEIKVWEVPRSAHYLNGRKFSLFFVVGGEVVVGIDNHKPKGPHLHIGGQELPFRHESDEQLLDDFWMLIRKAGFEP